MVNKPTSDKNIWVAAGDGDLERVKYLVETQGISPNTPDQYTYTPMHAAASYGHIDILEYLVSKGGDVNILDDDKETPLFVVESIEIAKWLVDHGCNTMQKNTEQLTAAESLIEDFPDIARWINSRHPGSSSSTDTNPSTSITTSTAPTDPSSSTSTSHAQPSTYTTDRTADALTSQLLSRVQEIITRSEEQGIEPPEEELKQLVGETVLASILQGVRLGDDAQVRRDAQLREGNEEGGRRMSEDGEEGEGSKRTRVDE